MNRKITVWERWDEKDSIWKHNHIESGWVTIVRPVGSAQQTKTWKTINWRYYWKHLNDLCVVV